MRPSAKAEKIPTPPFANATLTTRNVDGKKRSQPPISPRSANDPDIFVNVYLPPGTSSSSPDSTSPDGNLPYFYRGTRFEGGSMIGPILVTSKNQHDDDSNNKEPWHLHRNCWKFPYNRECVEDINGKNGGKNHGHSDDGRRERRQLMFLGRKEKHLTSQHIELGVVNAADTSSSDEQTTAKQDAAVEQISFEDILEGDSDPSSLLLEGSNAHDHHRHMHDHHGGHHPPYLNQHGYPPNYNNIPYADGNSRKTKAKSETHVIYGNDMWKVEPPAGHDPTWPESGVGLASEFGYGDDGAYCVPTSTSPCGWITGSFDMDYDRNDDDERSRPLTKIANGVLGYEEAKSGEPFLKIGVGKLVKGSCAACNSTDESVGGYKFNSPYSFYEEPVWTVVKDRPYHLVLEHEATLGGVGDEDDAYFHHHHHHNSPEYGYRLKKSMRVEGRVLSVTSTLTNLGRDRFATTWYSHHFFTCDGIGVGPSGAYGLDLEIRPHTDSATGKIRYDDSPWATPIAEYAEIREVKHVEEREDSWFDFFSPNWWMKKETRKTMQITITKEVEDGVRIKAEFPSDKGRSKGSFVMHGCGVSVAESIPELQDKLRPSGEAQNSDMSMYAYNLYIEKGTLSPEPLYLIELDGGASISWTQRVEIGLVNAEVAKMGSLWSEAMTENRANILGGNEPDSRFANKGIGPLPALFFVVVVTIVYSALKHKRKRKGEGYDEIPSV